MASVFAACRPSVVDKLFLIEALGPITAPADDSLDQLRRGMDQRQAFEEKLRVFAREEEAVEIRSKVNDLSRDAAAALVKRGLKAVPGGLLGAVSLFAVNYFVVRFLFRHRRLDQVLEGSPTTLVSRGKVIHAGLSKELLTESELAAVARLEPADEGLSTP